MTTTVPYNEGGRLFADGGFIDSPPSGARAVPITIMRGEFIISSSDVKESLRRGFERAAESIGKMAESIQFANGGLVTFRMEDGFDYDLDGYPLPPPP